MKNWIIKAIAITAATALSTVVTAQDTPADQPEADNEQIQIRVDQIIARVNGREVLFFDLVEEVNVLPPQVRNLPLSQLLGPLYPDLLNRLVEKQLLVEAAEEAGLDKDDDFKRQLESARKTILEKLYLEAQYSEILTDEVLREKYQAYADSIDNPIQHRARHILVATEEEAKDIIAKLDAGEKFPALAEKFSTGPTGANGGDLGYFAEGQMVQPFYEAAVALGVGKYSAEPVQTQFGWHIIKLEEIRERPTPPFEEVVAELRVQEQQALQVEILAGLKSNAQTELYDLRGELLVDETAAAEEEAAPAAE